MRADMTHSNNAPAVSTVLSVPGPWSDLAALTEAIRNTTRDFTVHMGLLTHSTTGDMYQIELMEHDAQLQLAYQSANRGSLNAVDLAQVGNHVCVAYLVGAGGSPAAARNMMAASAALLLAGGYAVKVETAGVAHSAREWLAQTARRDTHEGALYIAYVALVGGRGDYYSCGMHNLGLPDAIVNAVIGSSRAGELLRDFLMGLVHDPQQDIAEGTIITDVTGARYRLSRESCNIYPADDLYFNPYGLWRLTDYAG